MTTLEIQITKTILDNKRTKNTERITKQDNLLNILIKIPLPVGIKGTQTNINSSIMSSIISITNQ